MHFVQPSDNSTSNDIQAWVNGLGRELSVPWRWRAPGLILEFGPGDPWLGVVVHFNQDAEWHMVTFERVPIPAICRGSLPGELSTSRVVRGVALDCMASTEPNAWLGWYGEQVCTADALPEWVVRGLLMKHVREASNGTDVATQRVQANYLHARRKAQESLMANHPEEYNSLFEQFLVLEGLASYNGDEPQHLDV